MFTHVEGVEYTPKAITEVIVEIAKVREIAMVHTDFRAATFLSHNIAYLHELKERIEHEQGASAVPIDSETSNTDID